MNFNICIFKKLILFLTVFKKFSVCTYVSKFGKYNSTIIEEDFNVARILKENDSSLLNNSNKEDPVDYDFENEKKKEKMKKKLEKEERIKKRQEIEEKNRQKIAEEEKKRQEEKRKQELEKIEQDRIMEEKSAKERSKDWPTFYKKKSLLNQIVAYSVDSNPMKILKVNIRRKYLLFDSYDKLAHLPGNLILERNISFTLEGEVGSDFAGLTREWLRLFVNYMLNEKLNLFTVVNKKEDTYLPSNTKEKIKYVDFDIYRLIGRVLGYIIMFDQPTNVRFQEIFFKQVFGLDCTMKELYDVDPELTKSLKSLQEQPVDGIFFENEYGEELIPNGSNCAVNKGNAARYCDLYLKNKFCERVEPAYELIKQGLYESLPHKMVLMFHPWEYDFLVSGNKKLDVDLWKKNTHYKDGYTINSRVINWFWNYIDKIDEQKRLRLYEIITSFSHVPYFKILKNKNYTSVADIRNLDDFELMIIRRDNSSNRCPVAHTCTRTLDLPDYATKEQLERNLEYFASPEAEVFHLA